MHSTQEPISLSSDNGWDGVRSCWGAGVCLQSNCSNVHSLCRRRDSSASNMDSEAMGYSQTATQDSVATGSSLPIYSKYGRQRRGSRPPRLARPIRNFNTWNRDESMLSLNSHEHAVDHSSGELRTRSQSDAGINSAGQHGSVQPSRSLDSMYQCHGNGSQEGDDPMTGAVYIRFV